MTGVFLLAKLVLILEEGYLSLKSCYQIDAKLFEELMAKAIFILQKFTVLKHGAKLFLAIVLQVSTLLNYFALSFKEKMVGIKCYRLLPLVPNE